MNRLPIIFFKGKQFFLDVRLNQIRNTENPHEFFDFNNLGGFELAFIKEHILSPRSYKLLAKSLSISLERDVSIDEVKEDYKIMSYKEFKKGV